MIRNKVLTILFFIPFLLLVDSCKKENMCDCVKSTGSDVRSDRPACPFKWISLEGKIDLVITQDTTERLYVVAGRHLIDNIETSVSAETLYIKNHNICNFVRSYGRHITVYASVKYLRELLYYGAGDVTCTNALTSAGGADTLIGVESFEGSGNIYMNVSAPYSNFLIHTGPANIYVQGSVQNLYLYNIGDGQINTTALAVNYIHVENGGSGDTYIRSTGSASSYLRANIYGIGNVYCKGNPANFLPTYSGTGRVILE